MPTLDVIRLSFPGGLHVGTHNVALETSGVCVHSDTLFAALMDIYRRDGGDPAEWVQAFPRAQLAQAGSAPEDDRWEHITVEAPFLITTAFPYAGEVYFFPMPASLQRFFGDQVLKERRKDISRIRYVSLGILQHILKGERVDAWLFPADSQQNPTKGVALQGGEFWLTLEESEQLARHQLYAAEGKRKRPPRALRQQSVFQVTRVPRVTVSRITSASEIFHAGRVSFASDCGLWFGVQWRSPDAPLGQATFRSTVERLLTLLGDDGLGGERTTGYGAFRWQRAAAPLTLPDPLPGAPALLLSRYHPRAAELPDVLTHAWGYTLTAVGGWLRTWDAAAQRRRRIWLVHEGGVVHNVGTSPWGDVVDVRPVYRNPGSVRWLEHPVWRYGLALAIGVTGGGS